VRFVRLTSRSKSTSCERGNSENDTWLLQGGLGSEKHGIRSCNESTESAQRAGLDIKNHHHTSEGQIGSEVGGQPSGTSRPYFRSTSLLQRQKSYPLLMNSSIHSLPGLLHAGKEPIVTHMAHVNPQLAPHCCLRCSKRITVDLNQACGVVPNIKCEYCAKQRESCDPVLTLVPAP